MTEHQLQSMCVKWFRLQYPQELLASFPNAAKRSPRLANAMRSEGLVAGMPDLFLFEPSGKYHGLAIEMKVGSNKPTAEQERVLDHLASRGYWTAVIYDFEDFKELIDNYFNYIPNLK